MPKLIRMGRKPLGRVPRNITLPKEMDADVQAVADHQGRAVSSLIEELLRPYLAKSKATMPADPPPKPHKK